MILTTSTLRNILALFLLFIFCIIIYAPGLNGNFLFDDWANLPAIGHYGPVNNLETFILYITGGISGPTGRPVSLLSFLIDTNNWPADPWNFKRTNLIIHLINGLLVYFLNKKTLIFLNYNQNLSFKIALFSTAIWLIHPFLVSTVLYPVQRMTLLSATFTMSGLLAYIHFRFLVFKRSSFYILIKLSFYLLLLLLLATLSKENGALLLLLIFLYELIILKPQSNLFRNRAFYSWFIIFIIIPSMALLFYLLNRIPPWDNIIQARGFSPAERLLTESRIIIDYLYHLLLPQAYTGGLYNDDIVVSSSLISPITTLFSVLTIITLLIFSIFIRKKHPLLSLAILFFFLAHLMESGLVMLELYFEHRNYLPSIFLFLPIAATLIASTKLRSIYKQLIVIITISIIAILTLQRTLLWGNPIQQSLVWALESPDSPRAQTVAALNLQKLHRYSKAEIILKKALEKHPENLMLNINYFGNRCIQKKITQDDFNHLTISILASKKDSNIVYNAIKKLENTNCLNNIGLTKKQLIDEILLKLNKKSQYGLRQNLLHLKGKIYIKQKKPISALETFNKAIKEDPTYNILFSQVSLLAGHEYFTEAQQHLNYFKSLKLKEPTRLREKIHSYYTNNYFKREIKRIEILLADDIDSIKKKRN